MANQQLGTNTFTTAKWIVSPTASDGTHTTIAAALTSASSGDTILIRAKSTAYTEDLTLKAGVNLVAHMGDAETPNVTISGKLTATFSGTCTISGIRLQTNSDNLLVVSGSSATIVYLENCYLNCTNNTGISYTSSSSSSRIWVNNCNGDLGTTGITYVVSTSTGTITFNYCQMTNTGASTTASSTSAGTIYFYGSYFFSCFSSSSTGNLSGDYTRYSCSSINTTCITANGTFGQSGFHHSFFASGSASAISVGTGVTALIESCTITSNNTNAITGAGSVQFGNIVFDGTSAVINTTTRTALLSTEIHQVVTQVFTGSGTYTPTTGMKYCVIEVLGGGGGGGATSTTGASTVSVGSGGGGGGYARKTVTASTIGASQVVTVGTGGLAGAVAGGTGGTGVTSSVGAIVTASGGVGGPGSTAGATAGASGGAGGVGASGDFNINGGIGGYSYASFAAGILFAGPGGTSYFGGGALSKIGGAGTQAGSTGTNYGSGGSGAGTNVSSTQAAGGAGAPGIVVITEYV